jgi:transposase
LDADPTFGVFFMARHGESFKLEVVQRYLSESAGARTLASQYGLDHATVRRWVESYRQHGEEGLRKKSSRYDAQFKLAVLRRMWQEELSRRQVAALFDLRGGHGVVSTWERQYHEGGVDALKPKPRGRPKRMTAPKPPKPLPPHTDDARTLEALRKENEYLRAEVAYLKKLDALVRANRQAAQKKRKP